MIAAALGALSIIGFVVNCGGIECERYRHSKSLLNAFPVPQGLCERYKVVYPLKL